MKRTSPLCMVLSLIMTFALVSCVDDGDYNIPAIDTQEPNITANTTIAVVKNMYAGSVVNFTEAGNGGDLIIEGYVVSSDEAGNFYKTLIIQDKPEAPTAAIQIDVDVTSLYAQFSPGRKVYVKLNGLGMQEQNGVLHIGTLSGSNIERIPAFIYNNHIIRSTEMVELVPLTIAPNQYHNNYINMLVKIDNMQLSTPEVGEPYGYANNTYTANRSLQNCLDKSYTILRNSGFADFKNQIFPQGNGSIVAVFSKYNSDYQLFIRDTDDVSFNGERCNFSNIYNPTDPLNLPFQEDFEDEDDGPGKSVDMLGWGNFNVNKGSNLYEIRSFNNNKCAQLGAYNSGETTLEAWLVSPGLIIDAGTANPVLSFETNDGYNNGEALSVYLSTDFSGDVTTAMWTQINATISNSNSNGYGSSFTESGELDLSDYVGQTIYIGFKYTGGSNGITTTMQIDNLYVGESINTNNSSNVGLAIAGGNFENFDSFTGGLSDLGLKSYAAESIGNGIDGSTALHINTAGASGNDYVFTSLAHNELPGVYSKIKFNLKGTSGKTISINLYKTDGSYYRFNLDNITADTTITASASNKYTGVIDTGGNWVEITLDLSGITDLNVTDISASFFALKVGKSEPYDLYLDNVVIE
ncbi:MAG: DUF5689 domain-containing protein [Aestuariibaculum sp.]